MSGVDSQLYSSAGPSAFLCGPLATTIRTAKDLAGKTIGVSTLRDLAQVAIMSWIDQNGGDSHASTYVELPPLDIPPSLERGRIAAGLHRNEDGAGLLADARVRHGAAPQKSRDLGRDGRVSGSPGEFQAAQSDGRDAHGTSFSMGRMRMPDAPAALRRGSSDQTWSASTTEWIAIMPS